MSELRDFVADLMERKGAIVEALGPDALAVLAPAPVRTQMGWLEFAQLGFGTERPHGAIAIGLEGDWLDRFGALLEDKGRWSEREVRLAAVAAPGDPERMLERVLDLPNAVWRFQGMSAATTRCVMLAFRFTAVSDEKREGFHLVAVSLVDGSTWPVDPDRADRRLTPRPSPEIRPDLETAYRLATESLRLSTGVEVERFRTRSLGLLEEEVRRIFGYFDRTIDGLRESDPGGSQDLLRAVMAERDRRLTEAVERFDPKASASLCSIRAILVPTARLEIEFPDGARTESRLDAWSRRLRSLACGMCGGTEGPWRPSRDGLRCARCAATQAESARPRGRPRSDTPRRGTRAGEASARASRGSTARSRGASSGRPRP